MNEENIYQKILDELAKMPKKRLSKVYDFIRYEAVDEDKVESDNIKKSKVQEVEEFLDKWYGFFSEIETDDVRYNAIIGKDK